jgi:hypothetical protein
MRRLSQNATPGWHRRRRRTSIHHGCAKEKRTGKIRACGESGTVLCKWLKRGGKREKVLFATKVGMGMGRGITAPIAGATSGDHVPRMAPAGTRRIPDGEGTEGNAAQGKGDGKMKRTIVLFLILSMGIPASTHAQSAKDALMALEKLEARCQGGISYSDYVKALGEAKFRFNLYYKSPDAEKYPDLSDSFEKAILHYEFAGMVWRQKMSKKYGEFIDIDSELGKSITRSYPNAIKGMNAGSGMDSGGYAVDVLLPLIWAEASKELEITTNLYAKLGKISSDEMKKLKKEIAALKGEAAKLPEESSTYDIVSSCKVCKETPSQEISCEYKVGKDLLFSIDGIGGEWTGIAFMKSDYDGDFYAAFGIRHGCVIVKRGKKNWKNDADHGPGSPLDYAFVSPKNGKVYRDWIGCKDGK